MIQANPNDTVRFDGQQWRIETRIGGVYQLRAFRADGLGLTDDLRLAQRHQFTVIQSGKSGSDIAKPTGDIARKPYLRRVSNTRDRMCTAFAPDDVMAAPVPTDEEAYSTGDVGEQLRRAMRAGVNIDADD